MVEEDEGRGELFYRRLVLARLRRQKCCSTISCFHFIFVIIFLLFINNLFYYIKESWSPVEPKRIFSGGQQQRRTSSFFFLRNNRISLFQLILDCG